MSVKKYVADVNVLVSAAIFPMSIPGIAIKKVFSDGIFSFSDEIVTEYTKVLSDKKFDKYISLDKRLLFLEKIIALGVLFEPGIVIKHCRDPKDDKYLSLAVSIEASCIITGDDDLLVLNPFQNIPILSPADFLKSYQ